MSDYSDLIAQFAAGGGTVKKIPEGESSGITPREWHNAVTGESKIGQSDFDAEKRYHDMHDNAVESRLNGRRVTGYDSRGNISIEEE